MSKKNKKGSNNDKNLIKRTISKKKKNKTVNTVKKMLKMMTSNQEPSTSSSDSKPNENVEEFLSTGRTGRRNALPDILNDHSLTTSSELPIKLESLTTKDNECDLNQPSTSKTTPSSDR